MVFHFSQSDRVICDKHRAGVEAQDTIPFINLLVAETINNKLFKEFCGYSEETNTPAMTAKIPEVLPNVLPLCCFLRDPVVNRIKSEIAAKKSAPPSPGHGIPYYTVPGNDQAKQAMEQVGWRFVIGLENLQAAETFTMGYRTGRTDQEASIAVLLNDDPAQTRYEIWARPKQ